MLNVDILFDNQGRTDEHGRMTSQVTILLKIEGRLFRFITIAYGKKDSSYYLIQHLKDEAAPLLVAKPIHLLKPNGRVIVENSDFERVPDGNQIHLSIHPHRLCLRKKHTGGSSTHLIDEYELQKFNEIGIRLHCIVEPPPPVHMKVWTRKPRKDEHVIVFEWSSARCPQISLYEIRKDYDAKAVEDFLVQQGKYEIVPTNGRQPDLAFTIKGMGGDPGLWPAAVQSFGRLVEKPLMTKMELQKVLNYNGIQIDISSLPDDAAISDFKMHYPSRSQNGAIE